MSYLARLKAEFSEKQVPQALTKLTETPSVGSVSSDGDALSRSGDSKLNAQKASQRIEEFFQQTPPHAPTKLTEGPSYCYPAKCAQLIGQECLGCAHLVMNCERRESSRRIWFWRCGKGHELLEMGYGGERLVIAPESCKDWEQWVPGKG